MNVHLIDIYNLSNSQQKNSQSAKDSLLNTKTKGYKVFFFKALGFRLVGGFFVDLV